MDVDLTADDGSMFLALFIEKSEVPESDIKKHLENKLPPHMHPRRISLVQDLPLNTNGKIDRHALRELARSG